MKVAAYQAPLLKSGSMEAVGLIKTQIEILCCPEAILGGLADGTVLASSKPLVEDLLIAEVEPKIDRHR